jgi:SAM-dependent methyltransferase
MKDRLVAYLACPECEADLTLAVSRREDAEIIDGTLTCTRCGIVYPIQRGVPRFAADIAGVEALTAEAFGYEWTRYSELAVRYRQQFLDWIRPVGPGFLRGKLILEGGCGKGRHTAVAAELGARDIVAIDLSAAVDAAFANTRHLPNAHIVQGDLNSPPVKRVFDYAFSIGVLHHLPDPERGFRALVSRVTSNGAVSAWVYGREGNGWIIHLVSPFREKVASRMSHGLLDTLSAMLALPLFLTTRLIYRPRGAKAKHLPYGEYLYYISRFPYREQRSIVFDHLVAPVAFYLRKEEFAAWFERAGLTNTVIQHHNANSWRGFARVPASSTR